MRALMAALAVILALSPLAATAAPQTAAIEVMIVGGHAAQGVRVLLLRARAAGPVLLMLCAG